MKAGLYQRSVALAVVSRRWVVSPPAWYRAVGVAVIAAIVAQVWVRRGALFGTVGVLGLGGMVVLGALVPGWWMSWAVRHRVVTVLVNVLFMGSALMCELGMWTKWSASVCAVAGLVVACVVAGLGAWRVRRR